MVYYLGQKENFEYNNFSEGVLVAELWPGKDKAQSKKTVMKKSKYETPFGGNNIYVHNILIFWYIFVILYQVVWEETWVPHISSSPLP